MTAQPRFSARRALRGAVALAASVVILGAGTVVVVAVAFARLGSRWGEVRVYDDTGVESMPVDIYAQPPLSIVGWVVASAFVVAAYAETLWGVLLIVRVFAGARGPGRTWLRSWKPTRIAASAFVWGVVALSAYSLGIFLWDWIEWWRALDGGLTLANDPKPEPNPAFDPWQIPLGIMAFSAIGALPLVVRSALRKRGSHERSEARAHALRAPESSASRGPTSE